MRVPQIDKRSENDLIKHIKNISFAYTPEWRFDEDNPDVGTALAYIYAGMFADTLKRFNKVAIKNMLSFFNAADARLLPAIPATGYVKFGLAGQPQEGVPVSHGTQLVADVPDGEVTSLIFETVNAVYVSPAEPVHIFDIDGSGDRIVHSYQPNEENTEPPAFVMFDPLGENLQEHCLYFCHDEALNIKNAAVITVSFSPHHRSRVEENILQSLLNEDIAVWEYLTAEGYSRFAQSERDGQTLRFYKAAGQPAFCRGEEQGVESCWIRCRVLDVSPFSHFYIDQMQLSVAGADIRPELINVAEIDQSLNGCFAFSEKFSVFDALYFASAETLGKKGATIKLSFKLDFIRIKVDLDIADPAINWKSIMRRSDYQPDKEFDITIEEVLWEYFNGKGWARLFPGKQYADAFSTDGGTRGQEVKMTFICPEDIQMSLNGAAESIFIRARILKVNNAYKTKGHYVSPFIEDVVFSYDYGSQAVLPHLLLNRNNLDTVVRGMDSLKDPEVFFPPFEATGQNRKAMYFGFEIPPVGGPIKVLFDMESTLPDRPSTQLWEYFGRGRWNSMNVVDETEDFSRTGIVTFMGAKDFQRCRMWGLELFWIRVVDADNYYGLTGSRVPRPLVRGLHMNATQIIQLETQPDELFFVEPQEAFKTCRLLNPRVHDLEVWVDEASDIDVEQYRQAFGAEHLEVVNDANGEPEAIWVRWQEVDEFSASQPDDRHYTADRNEGIINFGDGINGRIPLSGERETIRVSYRTGGGEAGNLLPGMVARVNRALGFVNSVTNPEITSGGCDQETVSEAVLRSAMALRHGYRGVTTRDYEALAMEASRNILKAKCFANFDEHGRRRSGSVTLAILQKNFEHGRNFFNAIREQVTSYIEERISGNIVDLGRFKVVEPQFLELSVKVELAVVDLNRAFTVQDMVIRRLQDFINPMSGNFNGSGWDIGTIPNRTQLLNCLKDIPYISFIRGIFISATTQGAFGTTEVDLDNVAEYIFAQPLSGTHEVIITIQ
ncbi:MAG: baseplate J/gp47 family protein [Syntrophomonadaceae bacterium]|nr:baseplate J/gp47 family protein [Syntrophomonadaceae bacterium]